MKVLDAVPSWFQFNFNDYFLFNPNIIQILFYFNISKVNAPMFSEKKK